MSQIFVGSDVVWSNSYQKNILPEFTCIHIYLDYVRRSSGLPQPWTVWTPYWQSIVLYLLSSITEGEAGGSGQSPRLQGLSVVSLGQYWAICLSEHPYITSATRLGGWFKKWQMVMKIYLFLTIRTTIWR